MSSLSSAGSSRFRVAIFWSMVILLAALFGASWMIQGTGTTKPVARTSILVQDFPEAKSYASASQVELLLLADREVKSLLAQFPKLPGALNVKANRDFLVSNMVAAEQTWKSSLELDPRNPDALFGLANLAFQAGRYDEAIAICEGLQRINPGNPRVPLLLADSFMNSGKTDSAALSLEQHIISEPTSVQALNMLGTAQLNLQNYEKAIFCFSRVLEYAPDSKDAYYGLGQSYARQGDKDKATANMRRFAEIADASSQTNAQAAQAFEDREQAAHVAAQVFLDSALVYKAASDLPAAQIRILSALRLQPDVAAWLHELQRVLQKRGLRWEAIDAGQRLVSLMPKNVEHWLTLGSLYAELQQPEPAIDAFRRAIELVPDDPRCRAAESIILKLK